MLLPNFIFFRLVLSERFKVNFNFDRYIFLILILIPYCMGREMISNKSRSDNEKYYKLERIILFS